MKKTLGETLQNCRKIKGLRLRDVEKGTKISNAYLSQLEHNKIKAPSPHILHKLAEFYKISYEQLLKFAGYIFPKTKEKHKRRKGIAFSLLNDITSEEAEKLLEFLEFIRYKRKKKIGGIQ